jgi:hypothetical protein
MDNNLPPGFVEAFLMWIKINAPSGFRVKNYWNNACPLSKH